VTTPPVPDRLAEIVADAVARLEAAGETVTAETVRAHAVVSIRDVFDVIVPCAFEAATADYLRRRDADA
jgi:hypothetical protein